MLCIVSIHKSDDSVPCVNTFFFVRRTCFCMFTEFYLHHCCTSMFRIFKILDTEPTIPTSGGIWPAQCTGRVNFENVSFTYPTRADVSVLKNFSLTVEPKQTVALVGTSGSG